MIEGKIDEDMKDYVTIRSAQLPDVIYVGHGISGYEGQDVAFGVRPEKVQISKEEPAQPHNKARGKIEDIAELRDEFCKRGFRQRQISRRSEAFRQRRGPLQHQRRPLQRQRRLPAQTGRT